MKVHYGSNIMSAAIELNEKDVTLAIEAYLITQGVSVSGPRTIRVNGKAIEHSLIFVDSTGSLKYDGEEYNLTISKKED